MTTAEMTERFREAPRREGGKFVGAYYLLTLLITVFVLFFHGRLALTADIIATIFYLAVTMLFYGLSMRAGAKNLNVRSAAADADGKTTASSQHEQAR